LNGYPRTYTLGRACDIVEPLAARLMEACPALAAATPAGGIRRYEPLVEALTIVGSAQDPESATEIIATLPEAADVRLRTERQLIVAIGGAEVDIRIAAPDEYGTALLEATGSRDHVAALLERLKRARAFATEEDGYRAAGLPWIAPELRQGTGEIEAAAEDRLPSLIEPQHVRGDLHMHTTYSDGQDSLEAMLAAASALGFEYVAVTDHSERANAARTLTLDSLARQRDEIARLRERYPSMAILHGIETDIMPDGRLDFEDEDLEALDIVLASLHDHAGHDSKRLTRRCLAAIRHPLVSIITHPANRIVGRRSAYPLDFDAIYEAAAQTGTALEIDGAPAHLDLDGEHARAAVAAGVTVAIDTDCHRAGAFARHLRFAVGTARRGWVEPRHALNARPLADVRRFIAEKRSG
jgi:DNA polymerase (family 10)